MTLVNERFHFSLYLWTLPFPPSLKKCLLYINNSINQKMFHIKHKQEKERNDSADVNCRYKISVALTAKNTLSLSSKYILNKKKTAAFSTHDSVLVAHVQMTYARERH